MIGTVREAVAEFRSWLDTEAPGWGRALSVGGLALLWCVLVAVVCLVPQEKFVVGQSAGRALALFGLRLVAVTAVLFLLGWLVKVSPRQVWVWIGLAGPRGSSWWRWLWIPAAAAAGYVLGVAVSELAVVWPSLQELTPAQQAAKDAREVWFRPSPSWMTWAHAAGEELLMRTVVVAAAVFAFADGPVRVRGVSPYRLAVLAAGFVGSSLLFASIHLEYGLYNVVATLLLGSACALFAIATRSIWPAVVLHAVYNTPDLAAALTHLW